MPNFRYRVTVEVYGSIEADNEEEAREMLKDIDEAEANADDATVKKIAIFDEDDNPIE